MEPLVDNFLCIPPVYPILQLKFSFYFFPRVRRFLVIECFSHISDKINLTIYHKIGAGSLPNKLTDGFVYSINTTFCIIPEITFNARGYATLRLAIAKVIWFWQFAGSERCILRMDSKVWLICENQINVRRASRLIIWAHK